jgi:hypothetical protein
MTLVQLRISTNQFTNIVQTGKTHNELEAAQFHQEDGREGSQNVGQRLDSQDQNLCL